MLDLIFLVLMITVFTNAMFGKMNETLIAFTTVVGIAASVIGLASAIINYSAGSSIMLLLNLLNLVLAICTRFIAKRFVHLYETKREAAAENLRKELERHARRPSDIKATVFTDETFDDPDLRFNGEFKEYK